MLTKKQLQILDVFQKNEFKELAWNKVKELTKETSSSIIQNAIKAFLHEKLITENRIGTSKLYKVNHKNNKIYNYFETYNKESLPEQVLKSIKELEESLDKHTSFYSIVIFGSYAHGKQKKDSDLDVAVFKSMEIKSLIKIHGHAITKDEFLEMLKVDYENLGKEIARKHLIIHNPAIFYSLIKEGEKHGFKL